MKTLVMDLDAYAHVLKNEAEQDAKVPRARPRLVRRRRSRSSARRREPSARVAERDAPRLADEVISIVHHELLSPIASLRGLTGLLLDRAYPPAEQRRLIGVVHQETDRLTHVLQTFADLRRIESGDGDYCFQPVDLRAVVAESCAANPLDHCHLEVDIPETLPPLRADRRRLTQVFGHLLDNAFKFSRSGTTVSVTARATLRGTVVTVTDQGIGIPADALPRITGKFYRVPDHEIEANGTGLGLALVQRIVEDHGGRLELESEIDIGTTAILALPSWKQESPPGRPRKRRKTTLRLAR